MKKEILHLWERGKQEYIEGKISEAMDTIIEIRKQMQEESFENRKKIEEMIK
jgi:hypothetical protein